MVIKLIEFVCLDAGAANIKRALLGDIRCMHWINYVFIGVCAKGIDFKMCFDCVFAVHIF